MNTSWSGERQSFPPAMRRAILRRDPICCACLAAQSTVADHVVPVAEGGLDELSNGQGLCESCHEGKTHAERLRGQARRRDAGRRKIEPHPGARR